MLRLILISFSLVLSAQLPAQNSFVSYADSMLSKFKSNKAPGGAVAVIKNGKLIYENTFGMANIEKGIAITSETQFWIASVTKQFTAAAMYLLAAEKKIDLNQPVTKYLTTLPAIYNDVTIDQLLHHTSGIRDGFVLTALSKKPESEYTNNNVLYYLGKQHELNFKPGSQFEYNNSGYVLLAMVIEKVANESFSQFIQFHIFMPAGMNNTFVPGKYESSGMMAEGYRDNNGSFQATHFAGNTYGSTGIITTLHDLELWAAQFQSLSSSNRFAGIFKSMKSTGRLNNGRDIAYGGGVEKLKYDGKDVYEHFGADEGFKSNIVYFPSTNVSVIGLSNNMNDYDLSKRLYQLADFANGKYNTQPHEADRPADEDKLFDSTANRNEKPIPYANLAGEYHSAELETSYKIINKDDQLIFEFYPGAAFPLTTIANNVFTFEYVGANYLNFTKNGLLFSREGVRNLKLMRK